MSFSASRSRSRAGRGFTLMELTISMFLLTVVIVGVLSVFDSTNQLAKTQIHRVELQQSLRVSQREMVRTVRLAGRGGLPSGPRGGDLTAEGWAVQVFNNVSSRHVLDGGSGPEVVDDTDMLVVRGVINTPVYMVESLNAASFDIGLQADGDPEAGWVRIRDVMPVGSVAQDLDALCELLTDTPLRAEALLLVSAFDDRVYGVAEIDHSAAETDRSECPTNPGDPAATEVTLGFKYGSGSPTATEYAALSSDGTTPGVFPAEIFKDTRIASIGILEEYRFYLREGQQMDNPDELGGGSAVGEVIRKLSRARVYPKTDLAYAGNLANLQVDIAENVIDFQVALAVDGNEDGMIPDTGDQSDEWIGNHANDDRTAAEWEFLKYVRLNTLARAAEGDRGREAQEIIRLEDRAYSSSDEINQIGRRYARIVLRSNAEMRNL